MDTHWLLVPSLALAVGFGAWAGVGLGRAPGPAAVEALDVGDRSAADREGWRVLHEDLSALRALLERAAEPDARVPATTTADHGDLAAAVRALTEAVRERAPASGGPVVRPASPARPAGALGVADRASLVRSDSDESVLTSGHLFWSLREVVERYGPPDFIGIQDGSLSVQYEGEPTNVSFLVHEGIVVRVDR